MTARPLAPAGLCGSCRHARRVESRRSAFLRCGRSDVEPAFPRYPALPVRACRGYEPDPGGGDEEGAATAG